jgi:hypothetical protein
MSFELPTTFSKVIENPRKYELLLNKLAEDGFGNRKALMNNTEAVIAAINARVPGMDEKSKHKKRYFLSAINWVLPKGYVARKNPYWHFWQTVIPDKNLKNEEAWVKKSQYVPDE